MAKYAAVKLSICQKIYQKFYEAWHGVRSYAPAYMSQEATPAINLLDIVKWHAEDGDILFVNADAIDVSVLKGLSISKMVIIIPVYCTPGTSISNSVALLRSKEAKAI